MLDARQRATPVPRQAGTRQEPSIVKTAILIAVIGCAVAASATAQPAARPSAAPGTPAPVRIELDDFIGPFAPTPQSRSTARTEAYAAYAWDSRACHESSHGQGLSACLAEARQDRDAELAYANGGSHRSR